MGDALTPTDDGFAAWVSVRRPQLRRTAYLLCGDWSEADDLVQDALLRVYRRWRRLYDGNPDAYARRALTSAYVDQHRRAWWRRERPSAELPERAYEPAPGADPELARALARLGPRQRAVVVLRYWDDLSVEQTAEVLGCSAGNVKSQASRGLARLRELLEAGDIPLSQKEFLP